MVPLCCLFDGIAAMLLCLYLDGIADLLLLGWCCGCAAGFVIRRSADAVRDGCHTAVRLLPAHREHARGEWTP